MAASKKIILKKVNFTFSVTLEGDETEHISSEIIMNDIHWKIKICERKDRDETVVEAALMCKPPKNLGDSKWYCEAMATVSLISFDINRQFNLTNIPATQFEDEHLSSQLVEIIRSTDLKKDQQISFDVHLLVNPPFYHTSTDVVHLLANFQFSIKNVSGPGRKFSPDINVRGTIWNVFVQKIENDLAIFLNYKRNEKNVNWCWQVECSFTLLSFDKNVGSVTKNIRKNFKTGLYNGWGCKRFLDWKTFLDPEKAYVRNDEAIFEIDLKVEPPRPLWSFEQAPLDTKGLECSICLNGIINRSPAATKCGHLFCNACIRNSVEHYEKCPNCNTAAKLDDIRPIFI